MIIRLNGWKHIEKYAAIGSSVALDALRDNKVSQFFKLRECEIFMTAVRVINTSGMGSYTRLKLAYIPISSEAKETFKQWEFEKLVKNMNYKYIKSNYFIKQSPDRDSAYIKNEL